MDPTGLDDEEINKKNKGEQKTETATSTTTTSTDDDDDDDDTLKVQTTSTTTTSSSSSSTTTTATDTAPTVTTINESTTPLMGGGMPSDVKNLMEEKNNSVETVAGNSEAQGKNVKINDTGVYNLWDVGFSSKEGDVKAIYSAGGADIRPKEGQYNVFANAGVANYSFATKNVPLPFSANVKLGLSGTLEGCTGETWIGIKDGQAGFGVDGGLLKSTLNINITVHGVTAVLGGEFYLGGAANGSSKGLGFSKKSGLGFAYGGSLHFEEEQ
jgi:hypothetical protein